MENETISFTKEEFEDFLREESDKNVGELLSILDAFKANYTLKSLIKNKIHQNSRGFVSRFSAFLMNLESFEFKFKKPSSK